MNLLRVCCCDDAGGGVGAPCTDPNHMLMKFTNTTDTQLNGKTYRLVRASGVTGSGGTSFNGACYAGTDTDGTSGLYRFWLSYDCPTGDVEITVERLFTGSTTFISPTTGGTVAAWDGSETTVKNANIEVTFKLCENDIGVQTYSGSTAGVELTPGENAAECNPFGSSLADRVEMVVTNGQFINDGTYEYNLDSVGQDASGEFLFTFGGVSAPGGGSAGTLYYWPEFDEWLTTLQIGNLDPTTGYNSFGVSTATGFNYSDTEGDAVCTNAILNNPTVDCPDPEPINDGPPITENGAGLLEYYWLLDWTGYTDGSDASWEQETSTVWRSGALANFDERSSCRLRINTDRAGDITFFYQLDGIDFEDFLDIVEDGSFSFVTGDISRVQRTWSVGSGESILELSLVTFQDPVSTPPVARIDGFEWTPA